jgi:hypothetical protein
MAVRLTVGLQKKIGLPDYGSLGASCSVEIEIDRSVFESNGFQDRVNLAFNQCRAAVDQQLATAKGPPQIIDVQASPAVQTQAATKSATQPSASVSNSDAKQSKPAPATQSQLRAIFGIARRYGLDPQQLVNERFNVQAADQLSIRQASQLIDELKRMPQEIAS